MKTATKTSRKTRKNPGHTKKNSSLPAPAYYGLLHTLPPGDKRRPKLLKQLQKQGFDDTETWSMYSTIASFIIPRLTRFREIHMAYPAGMSEQEWADSLASMEEAFRLILQEDKTQDVFGNDSKMLMINKGLDLFREHFLSLWW